MKLWEYWVFAYLLSKKKKKEKENNAIGISCLVNEEKNVALISRTLHIVSESKIPSSSVLSSHDLWDTEQNIHSDLA